MSSLWRAALVAGCLLNVAAAAAGPRSLSTLTVEGPTAPAAPQLRLPPARAVRLNDAPQSLPTHGNFSMQPLPRAPAMYVPSFTTMTAPVVQQPSVGRSTVTGGRQHGRLRQMSLDPAGRVPATITAGAAQAPPHVATPRPSYGPQWLTIEIEQATAAPRAGRRPGLPPLTDAPPEN